MIMPAGRSACPASRRRRCRRRRREEEDLKGGAVLKGTVEPGEGDETPKEGDLVRRCVIPGTPGCCLPPARARPSGRVAPLSSRRQVFLHYSLLDEEREVLLSTRSEHGGSGCPQPFVLGRGRRMLRGMELAVLGASREKGGSQSI